MITNKEPYIRHVREELTFNSNGKYIFSGHVPVISAKPMSANLTILISSNGENTVFTLYSIEGTSFLRQGAQTIVVDYFTM